jgi:putative FmdB family regulatory protein
MPTYEYRCSGCGTDFELYQKISDEPAKSCPECGSSVQRIISAGAGFLFKGSGFYTTDYRSESYKKKAKEEKGSSGPGPAAKGDNCCGGQCKN